MTLSINDTQQHWAQKTLSLAVSSAIFLNVIMRIVIFFSCYDECRYPECHYAECRYAECHLCCVSLKLSVSNAEWLKYWVSQMLSVIYSECHYAECRYAECCYAECRGAAKTSSSEVDFVSFFFLEIPKKTKFSWFAKFCNIIHHSSKQKNIEIL